MVKVESASMVLYDHWIRMKLKWNDLWFRIVGNALRLTMLYGSGCWANKKENNASKKTSVKERRMLRCTSDNTLKDSMTNVCCKKIEVSPIENNRRENWLRWFGNVQQGWISVN